MEKFLTSAIPVYVMAVITVLGILGTVATGIYYRQMIKQTDNMMNVHHVFLQQIKNRFENTYRVNKGIDNIPLFIDKQLNDNRFLWMHVDNAGKLSLYGAMVCLIWGGNIALLRYANGLHRTQNIFLLGCTLVCAATGVFFYILTDIKGLQRRLRIQTQEYFTNTFSAKILRTKEEENGLSKAETKKSRLRGGELYFADLSRGKDEKDSNTNKGVKTSELQTETGEESSFTKDDIHYLKQSLERIAAGRERGTGKDKVHHFSEKEGKLIDDILKDYFE